ncbi:MAG: extracellular solute-binding protein [Planctomycetaceae bacterium]|nr:extracellular solute-binding protein [Planctomycetaceae bacterium]
MPLRFRNSFGISLLGFVFISLIVGCPEKQENLDTRPDFWQSVEPGGKFTLLVIDDAEVAKKIRQLAGTWEELTQATLTVVETTVEALLASGQKPEADAVICPIELQAVLVQLGYPTRITTAMHQSGGELWDDLLETYRTKLSRFGPDTMFVPMGSQFFVCYYRIDLLQQIKESPPANWSDYERLRVKLQNLGEGRANWSGAMEPTAPGSAGYAFLARAASYATHRDYYSTLFDVKTMTPLIATEPFVRALTEMQAANPPGTPQRSADDVRRAFWQGETALAITFPTAAIIVNPEEIDRQPLPVPTVKSDEPDFKAGVVMIPGSTMAYNTEKKIWDDRRREEPANIPTLISGHVGMVSAKTGDQVGMFKLLLWLSGREWGTVVFASSPQSGIGRKSGIEQISRWVEKEAMSEQTMKINYISVLSKHWSANEVFVVPSLPGYAEYMAALDREVCQVLDGRKEAQTALDEVARQWEAITEKYGVESQRRLYRQCCGLVAD